MILLFKQQVSEQLDLYSVTNMAHTQKKKTTIYKHQENVYV